MYGESIMNDQTRQKWFSKFYAEDILLNNAPVR